MAALTLGGWLRKIPTRSIITGYARRNIARAITATSANRLPSRRPRLPAGAVHSDLKLLTFLPSASLAACGTIAMFSAGM